MRIHRIWALGMIAALLCASVTAVALAEESPPTRVARLSYIGGNVSFEPAGTQNWTAAQLNRPVTLGDRIWADWDSRAELDIGDAVIRLGSRTGFSFLNLDALTAQMQLTAGTVIVRVRTLSDGESDEIDTPNLALELEQPGIYRVEVPPSGDITIVEVISGEALATGAGQSFQVSAQQSVTFSGTESLAANYAMLGEPDALDDWSMARDRQEEQAAAGLEQYVSPQVVGVDVLDTYGSWQDTPQWGYAWFPNVVVGWAPYRFGHWVWISPWGWTWIDDEPWGFAPFHYGRWAFWNDSWCWVPGPRRIRPVYAPALVAWVRGPHFGLSVSVRPHVGWLPLGPRDVYIPGYAASRAYVHEVNVTNARDIDDARISDAYARHRDHVYGNSRVGGAITVVPREVFTGARSVAPHRVVLQRHGATQVRFSTDAPAVTPLRASVLGVDQGRSSHRPPRQLIDRPVVARRVPPRASAPFERQQAAIRANHGRPLTAREWARLRTDTPAARVRMAPDAQPLRRERAGAEQSSGVTDQSVRPQAPAPRTPVTRPSRNPPASAPARAPRGDRPPWARFEGGQSSGGAPALRQPERTPMRPARQRERAREPIRPAPERFSAPARPSISGSSESPRPAPPSRPRFRPTPRPSPRSEEHAPPSRDRRAAPPERHERPDGLSETGFGAWHSAPPMYRPQPRAQNVAPAAPAAFSSRTTYAPPASPPPMYRPVPRADYSGGVAQAGTPSHALTEAAPPARLAPPRARGRTPFRH